MYNVNFILFISFIYTGTMHNKSVVPKLAIKLICICSPWATLQYSIKNNTTHSISHHTHTFNLKRQINGHIFDFLQAIL